MKSKGKQIFLLYSCDDWKSSTSLICASTSIQKFKKVIISEIEKGNMEYSDGEDDLSINKQVKLFNKDWKFETRNTINDRLKYGYYDYTYNGELI